MRRPVISILLAGGLLVAAAVPFFDINTGTSGVSELPDDFRAKQGYEAVRANFGFGVNAPAEIVIDADVGSDSVRAAIDRLTASLDSDAGFGPATLSNNETGDLALLSTPLLAGPSTEEGIDSVRKLRDEYVPKAFADVTAVVLVTGRTAQEIDSIDMARRYLPIVIALVLALSFVLLTMVFRSIGIATKAIILNLLSVGAAYGILVLVWQKGVGNELFGFPQVDVIQSWLPIMLFAILFGLSMDYQVFLISRIRERYLQTGDNEESVAYGLRSTAWLITGAALIMVAIFSGFAAGDLVPTSQFGFGMAVAILLDVTIVPVHPRACLDETPGRSELVPARLLKLAATPAGRGRCRCSCASAGGRQPRRRRLAPHGQSEHEALPPTGSGRACLGTKACSGITAPDGGDCLCPLTDWQVVRVVELQTSGSVNRHFLC